MVQTEAPAIEPRLGATADDALEQRLDAIALAFPISPTQIETYELCQRKWGFYKLDGIKREAGPAAKRGEEAHTMIEDWLRDGVPIDTTIDVGKVLEPGLKYLPPPKTGECEGEFAYETETVRFGGKIDWRDFKATRVGQFGEFYVRVKDHKTTSNIKKWAKVVPVLRNDPQSVIYAVRAILLSEDPDNTTVELEWVYYQWTPKKPKVRVVRILVVPDALLEQYKPRYVLNDPFVGLMSHQELETHFRRFEAIAQEMLEHHRQKRRAIDLPYDVKGCYAFGGCPYRNNPCKLNAREKLRGFMAQEGKTATSNLTDRVNALKAGKGGAAAAASTAPASTPTTPATPAVGGAQLTQAERLAAARARVSGGGATTTTGAGLAVNPSKPAAQSRALPAKNEAPPASSAAAAPAHEDVDPSTRSAVSALIHGAMNLLKQAQDLLK